MSNARKGMVFGKIAIKKGFISKEDLKQCIKRRKEVAEKDGPQPSLKEILLESGYVTEEQAEEIEEARKQGGRKNVITGYEFHEKLGEGAMGAVYRATQLSLDRTVAVKLLSPSVEVDETYIKRFDREARTAAKMNHENIIRAYDVGEEDGVHYFVMEYIDGKTLQEFLEEKIGLEQEAMDVGLQIARALKHADKHGLIHRDVKPENIMITPEGVAKLCDLGLAKTTDSRESTVTQEDVVVGTPHYMSPEQAAGDELDIRSDMYSLGASLYHAVTGVYPFSGEDTASVMRKHVTEELIPPAERNPEVSERTSAVIDKMMEKKPDDRYQNPDELIGDLERIQEGQDPEHAQVDRNEPQVKTSEGRDERDGTRSDLLRLPGNWKRVTAGGTVLILLMAGISYLLAPSIRQTDVRKSRSEEVVRKEKSQQSVDKKKINTTKAVTKERTKTSKDAQRPEPQKTKNTDHEMVDRPVVNKSVQEEEDGSAEASAREASPHRVSFERLKREAERVEGNMERVKKLDEELTSLIEEAGDSKLKSKIRRFQKSFLAEQAKRYDEEQITQNVTSTASLSELMTAYEQRRDFPRVLISTETGDRVKQEKKKAQQLIKASLDEKRRQVSGLIEKEAFQQAERIVREVEKLDLEEAVSGLKDWVQTRNDYVSERTRFERSRLEQFEQLLSEFKTTFRQHYQLSTKSVLEVSSNRANKMIDWYAEKVPIDTIREEIEGYRADVKTLDRFQKTLKETLQMRMQNGEGVEVNRRSGKLAGIGTGVLLVEFNGNRKKVPLSELDIQKRISLARGGDQQLEASDRMTFGLVCYLAGDLERAKTWFQKVPDSANSRAEYYLEEIRRWRIPSKQKEVHHLLDSLQRARGANLTFAMGNILDELRRYGGTEGLKRSDLIEQSRRALPYDAELFMNRELYNKRFTWMDANWSRRVKVTVNADRVTRELNEFPVYVDLSMMPDSFFQQVKRPEELRVTTSDGQTQLPREVVHLNRSKGTGALHFRADQLSPDDNQTFHIYYGNGNRPGPPASSFQGEQVWQNGYVLVLHLNEDSGGTAYDSSPAGHDGKVQGNTKQGASGVLDGAYEFDGNKSRVWITEESILPGHPYTFQAWVYIRSQKERQEMVGIHENLAIAYNLSDVDESIRLQTPRRDIVSESDIKLDKWTAVTGTVGPDGSGKLMINGSLENEKDGLGRIGTKGPNNHGGTRLGTDDDNRGGGVFDGLMDEVRISNVERSKAWIQTEYHNQTAPDRFLRISSEQTHPDHSR